MSVKYRKVKRKVLNGPDKDIIKTYAVAKPAYRCGISRLCNLVSARTKMWNSEVKSVIEALIWVMDMELREGAIVKVGDFGSFRYNIRSEGAIEEFKPHMIKGVKILFMPGMMLKDSMTKIGFEQFAVVKETETEPCDKQHVP